MRPDGVGGASVGLPLAGVVHEHQIHLPVAVVVIPGEIDIRIQFLAAFDDGFFGTLVVSLHVILAIIGIGRIHLHRTEDIENRLENPV